MYQDLLTARQDTENPNHLICGIHIQMHTLGELAIALFEDDAHYFAVKYVKCQHTGKWDVLNLGNAPADNNDTRNEMIQVCETEFRKVPHTEMREAHMLKRLVPNDASYLA